MAAHLRRRYPLAALVSENSLVVAEARLRRRHSQPHTHALHQLVVAVELQCSEGPEENMAVEVVALKLTHRNCLRPKMSPPWGPEPRRRRRHHSALGVAGVPWDQTQAAQTLLP